MRRFSFGQYADAPYDIITKEFQGNEEFHKQSKKVLTIIVIVGLLFFTFFFVIFAVFIFGIFSIKNKRIGIIKSLASYGLDYSVIKSLEKKGKLRISKNLQDRLPTQKSIQKELANLKSNSPIHIYENSSSLSDSSTSQQQEKMPELNFDFGEEEKKLSTLKKIKPKLSSFESTKTTTKRKSIFDDYASVRESFKKIRNR